MIEQQYRFGIYRLQMASGNMVGCCVEDKARTIFNVYLMQSGSQAASVFICKNTMNSYSVYNFNLVSLKC